MARRALIAVAVAGATLAATGCGRAGDRSQARAVTERFYGAVQRGDGATACEQLSADTRSNLESQEGKPCRRAITSLGLGRARVTRVQVFLTNAKVDLADGHSAFLGHGPDGWQLSAVGCSAQGKPADRPFDCALEA
jgi:hypothetical protein